MAATSLPLSRRQPRPAAPIAVLIQGFVLVLSDMFKGTRTLERSARRRHPHLSFDS